MKNHFYIDLTRSKALGLIANFSTKILGLIGAAVLSLPALAVNLTPVPPYLTETKGSPMVMLNMSKDHQLFFKAYNEYSDLDGDGVIETQYKHSYKYYGYFDNERCYNYSTTSNRYVPVGKVDAAGYCTNAAAADNWNGNFMNWATMTRMDVVRRILYGGFRAVDTATAATPSVSITVLERAHLPSDAHAFAKYYYGTDINKLTPFNPAAANFTISTGTGTVTISASEITLCNLSNGNAVAPAATTADAPSIYVASGNQGLWGASERWQCIWKEDLALKTSGGGYNGNNSAVSGVFAASDSPRRDTNGLGTGYAQGSYTARVEVCKTGLAAGFTGDEDSRCKLYPRGNYKPVGLLQKYGERNEAAFGLITGSFDKNISGGVLRKNVASFTDEVDLDDGQFKTVPGIVDTLNKLKIAGYSYTDGTHENLAGGCNFQQIGLTDGECRSWGNPIGEMYLESLRYLAGATASTDFITAGAPRDTALGLTVTAWSDPFAGSTVANFGEPLCRRSSIVNFNASVTSFDSNSWGGADSISGLSTSTVNSYTDLVGSAEGLFAAGSQWSVGRNGSDTNGFCTNKTLTSGGVNSFAEVTGVCPSAPTQFGGYKMAGAALYSHIKPIRSDFTIPASNTRAFKVDTYGVALSTGSPRVKIPVPGQAGKFVFISPAYRLDKGTGGGGTLVDFKVVYQTATKGKYLINWEDSEQGGDFDQDVFGLLEYSVNAATNVISITTRIIAQATANPQGFGYAISGTGVTDGIHFHSGILGFNYNDPKTITVAPMTATNATGGCKNCQVDDVATVASYNMAGISGQELKDPLWYAAKYGGFDRAAFTSTYVVGSVLPVNSWDLKSADGSTGADGEPDNYFLAVNPAQLERSLAQIFDTILKAGGSAPIATPLRTNAGGYAFLATQTIVPAASGQDTNASGQFLRYTVQADGSIGALPDWDGGLKLTTQDWNTGRNILTMSGTAGIPFRWTSLDAAQKVALRTNAQTGVQNSVAIGTNRLNWLRGDASNETTAGGLRTRPNTKLGAIINSSPWYIGEPSAGYSDTQFGGGYSSFKDSNTSTSAVFVAANDGMLHAFDVQTGAELFAYVPRGLYATKSVAPYSKLSAITSKNFELNVSTEGITADGSTMVAEMKVGSTWSQYLFGALGRGGKGVYALDVTKPQNVDESSSSVTKLVKWEYGASTADPDLGFIISRPTSRDNGQPFQTGYMANGKWAAIYGNGYNSASGQAALYIFFADGPGAGTATWTANTDFVKIPVGTAGADNGMGVPTAIDVDNNGTIDVIYAGDLKGNVWKFDVSSSNPALWKVATTGAVPMYQATTTLTGSTTVVPQPITTAVQPIRHPSGGFQLVFGTGKSIESIDYPMSAPYGNSIYGIRDPFGSTTTLTIGLTDLVQKSVTFATVAGQQIRYVGKNSVDYLTKKGWYIDLAVPSEGVVFNPSQLGSTEIFLRSIAPAGATDGCRVAEKAYNFFLNAISGTPISTKIEGATFLPNYLVAGETVDNQFDVSFNGTRTSTSNAPPACGASCTVASSTCECNPGNSAQCEVIVPGTQCCHSWEDCTSRKCTPSGTSVTGTTITGLGAGTGLVCGDRRLTWREIIRNR